MFTNKFFNILLNFGVNWEVSDVEADYKKEDIIIKLNYKSNIIKCKDTSEEYKIIKYRHMKQLAFLLVLFIFLGCNMSKEFDAELPETPKILGMYCLFSPDSIWNAQIFKLGGITDNEFDNSQLLIDDAQVKLYCNNQFQENLLNVGNGVYISTDENKPLTDNTYHIEVSKDSFPNIISDTASVLPKLQLDSIYLLDDPQLNLFSSWGRDEYEEDTQLNIYFRNQKKLPFNFENAGSQSDNIYITYDLNWSTYRKKDIESVENEMFFYRCNHEETCKQPDDFNILKLSYVSEAFFEFVRGGDIQDNARGSIINYYPGNVNSNIKNGLGLFVSLNYIKIDIDTLEVR